MGTRLSRCSRRSPARAVARGGRERARGASVSYTITNTGRRAGADVGQVYVTFPRGLGEPPCQLKGLSGGCYGISVGDSSRSLPLAGRVAIGGAHCGR